MESKSIKLKIENSLLKNGLEALLRKEQKIHLLKEDSLDELADICLFELHHESDIQRLKDIASISIRSRILCILSSDDLSLVTQALELQVAGIIEDNTSSQELLFALDYISKGHKYIAPAISLQFIEKLGNLGSSAICSSKMQSLSDRERDVLELIMNGHANREIAYQLFTTKRKVEEIRKSIMQKIGVENNLGLTAFYLNRTLFQ